MGADQLLMHEASPLAGQLSLWVISVVPLVSYRYRTVSLLVPRFEVVMV